ncbi:MAG: fructose-bisphosphate aldolase [Desulfovibrionales bacterium]|nr:fructose-bisphosphate aldolase [Desulfovibrionales bacterium]
MIGNLRKAARLFHPESKRTILLPLDHGLSEGTIPGLEDLGSLLRSLSRLPVQGVILHKGMVMAHAGEVRLDQALIVHLSAGTRHGLPFYNKALVCSVQEALRLGADMVSMHINIGNDLEDRMLSDLGACVEDAHQLGLPLLAMIYARGGQIVNENDPALVAHSIRIGAELGADVIKVPYCGSQQSFARAVAACPAPVVIGGGPRSGDFRSFLRMVREVLDAGAAGVCIGRNIFQQDNPAKALEEVCSLVHGA